MYEEKYDLDKAIEISNDAFSTNFEKENSKKKYKNRYKKGRHNRTRK